MGVRHSVSYIKLLVTGWTAGAVKRGEGKVVVARRNIGHSQAVQHPLPLANTWLL